jgi:hypothetical protein
LSRAKCCSSRLRLWAYVACCPFSNLSVSFAVGQADASALSADDVSSLAGISFGSQWGRVELASSSDVTFLLHVRFIKYSRNQACRPLFHPNDTEPVDLPSTMPKHAPPDGADIAGVASLVDDPGSASSLPIIAFSVAATVIVIFVIVQSRRRGNHQNYEEMDISDDEDLDTYIPAVVDRSAPGHVASPYVVCVIDEGSMAKCPQPELREGLQ